jgi:hypothetical protein
MFQPYWPSSGVQVGLTRQQLLPQVHFYIDGLLWPCMSSVLYVKFFSFSGVWLF